jgi:hypothetical protein
MPTWLTNLLSFKLPWEKAAAVAPPVMEIPDPTKLQAVQDKLDPILQAVRDIASTLSGWAVASGLLSQLDQVIAKAKEVQTAVAAASAGAAAAPSGGGGGKMSPWGGPTGQYGGLMTRPTIIGEAGPEMAIPMKDSQRSRDLLAQTASALGMYKGGKLIDNAARSKSMLESMLGTIGIDLDKMNIGGVNLGEALRRYGPGPAGAAENLGHAQEEIFHRLQGQGGGGGINLSMNSPITINGISGGDQAGSIAKEVESAMVSQTSYIREMLVQLMKAKDEERRMSYV